MSDASDLAAAFAALRGKQAEYELLWSYYDGKHPLVYATKKLGHLFKDLNARWCENWCQVAVDSLTDRVQLSGFHYVGKDAPRDPQAPKHPAQEALDRWWDAQEVAADAEEITKAVAVCSEAFYIAESGADGVRTIANAPHLCAVVYSEHDPKTPALAAKWWDEDERARLTLYYPDRLLHYAADVERVKVTSAEAFYPDPELPDEANPNGMIPLFHFRRSRRGDKRLDEGVIQLNNALNKLFADMMVSAEFAAYRQRYIISQGPVDGAKQALQTGQDRVVAIPGNAEAQGQNTEVGEFNESPLANYIAALDHIASRIAIQKHLPKHYLNLQGDVSGEALIAMEAGLVKEALAYQARLATTWRQCAAYVLKLSGLTVSPNDIEPVWDSEQTVQPYTEALIIQTLAKAGLPLATIMHLVKGWSDDQVAEMLADQDAAESRGATLGLAALQQAQARFDQGTSPGAYPQPGEAA